MAMIRHMAAAVLYAVISFTGSGDLNNDGVADDATDDDAGTECVALTPTPGKRDASLVLTAASALCGTTIDDAWLVQDHCRPAAAVAMHQTPQHVALVDVSAEAPQHHATLLARALDRCRENGAVKVIVQACVFDAATVRRVADARGFRFSRTRHENAGVAAIEFYTDLYWSEAARQT